MGKPRVHQSAGAIRRENAVLHRILHTIGAELGLSGKYGAMELVGIAHAAGMVLREHNEAMADADKFVAECAAADAAESAVAS
jgi:hypothetical protein